MPLEFVECEGAPRDLGLDQGRAFRDAIRDRAARVGVRGRRRFASLLQPLVAGRVLGRGVGRALLRHYPHQAERFDGVALGTELSLESVVALFARETAGWDVGLRGDALRAEAAIAAEQAGGARVLRTLGGGPDRRWVLRRSRPEIGFRSLEVTLPWLASAVAGVNEAGVAVAIAPRTAPPRAGEGQANSRDGEAVSAVLLVQECLQRFADLAACLDWCTKRPVWGNSSLLLADASGEVAAVEVAGSVRRVLRAGEGLLVEGAQLDYQAELRKCVAEHDGIEPGAVSRIEVSGETGRMPTGAVVCLDAAEHRISVEPNRWIDC